MALLRARQSLCFGAAARLSIPLSGRRAGKLRTGIDSRFTGAMASHVSHDFPIALLTDFGSRDHYAGVVKGVIASIAPRASVIDITHGVPAQSIAAGAIALAQSWRYFPARTVFMAVVDPGVGTSRAAIAIESRAGARFVGPDNGLLSLAAAEAGVKRAVKLESRRYRLSDVSSTFHGRDIFAPAAAWLWRGTPIAKLGPAHRSVRRLAIARPEQTAREVRGEVIYVDGFGNLVSNIDRAAVARFQACFPAKRLWVRIKRGAAMSILDAYGRAPKGVPLATFGSFGLLEVAVRDGSASAHFAAGASAPLSVVARAD